MRKTRMMEERPEAPEEERQVRDEQRQQEDEPMSDLQAQLDAVTAERDEYLGQARRALADYANFRRRTEQDNVKARENATRGLIERLVPIADELQRGLATLPENEKESSWVQGMLLIEKKLAAMLEREGVAPLEALGKPFDPSVHEAVATEPGSTQNIVVEVYQTGYMHGQGLLRPAVVKVGDKPEFQA